MAGGTNTESYGSRKVGPSFFMFSIADAYSTIDFLRAAIYEGVVDSPPSKEIGQTPLCSSSSLKSSRKDGNCGSLFPDKYGGLVHLRQLYKSGPLQMSTGLDMTNVGKSSPIMEWQQHEFSQKLERGLFLPWTKLLGTYVVRVGCLLRTQENNNQEDSMDAVVKL
jgi:hypothetical protein